jgi:DNA-binding transcriptional MerR regulator
LLTTAESARLVGVQPVTIRRWRMLGYLVSQGLNERGYPLHTREAVRAAERLVRENGLQASGIDPRQLRQLRQRPAAPLPLAA